MTWYAYALGRLDRVRRADRYRTACRRLDELTAAGQHTQALQLVLDTGTWLREQATAGPPARRAQRLQQLEQLQQRLPALGVR